MHTIPPQNALNILRQRRLDNNHSATWEKWHSKLYANLLLFYVICKYNRKKMLSNSFFFANPGFSYFFAVFRFAPHRHTLAMQSVSDYHAISIILHGNHYAFTW